MKLLQIKICSCQGCPYFSLGGGMDRIARVPYCTGTASSSPMELPHEVVTHFAIPTYEIPADCPLPDTE